MPNGVTPLLSSPRDYSLFEPKEQPGSSLPLAALRTIIPEGEGEGAVRGAETEMSVWPDFLSLEILQTEFSAHLFLTAGAIVSDIFIELSDTLRYHF